MDNLAPASLRHYTYSGPIDPTDKDTMVQLGHNFLLNLDELEGITKHKATALKEIITKKTIKVRLPYDKYAQELTRYASFCGSVNDKHILRDDTGSRRFLIHTALQIDYKKTIDIDAVFAEAYHAFKSGEKYWFEGQENSEITRRNSKFELKSVEEELLMECFVPADSSDPRAEKLRTMQILKRIYDGKLPNKDQGASVRLGFALRKQGFTSGISRGIKVWSVLPRDSVEASQTKPKKMLE